MKKLFTLGSFVILFTAQQAAAQIKKGEKMLGGSVSFVVNKVTYGEHPADDESKYTTVVISPRLGFGLGNNWILGISAGYTHARQEMEGTFGGPTDQRFNSFTGGLFVRKFRPLGDRFGFFGQAEASYGFGKTKQWGPTFESKSKVNSFGVSLKPGAYYKAGRRFIVEATIGNLGYNHAASKPENSGLKTKSSQFDLSLTNSLSLGFQVVL